MKHFLPVLALSFIFVASCKTDNSKTLKTDIKAPTAEKQPKTLSIHNDDRVDNYYWMNDREDPKVIDYLNLENEYYQESTAHTKAFSNRSF